MEEALMNSKFRKATDKKLTATSFASSFKYAMFLPGKKLLATTFPYAAFRHTVFPLIKKIVSTSTQREAWPGSPETSGGRRHRGSLDFFLPECFVRRGFYCIKPKE